MRTLINRTIILVILSLFGMSARAYAFNDEPIKANIYFVVKSVDAHPDEGVIRVSGDLKSRPNTSACIDKIRLVGNGSIEAVDTDGFDLERYFQWEEDGVIETEIDFPSANPQKLKSDFGNYKLLFILRDGRSVEVINKQ